MTSEIPRPDRETVRRHVERTLRLSHYLRSEGLLRFEIWEKRLPGSPGLRLVRKVMFDGRGGPRGWWGPVTRWRLRRALRDPALRRLLEDDFAHWRRWMARTIWSRRNIRAPEVKSAEWQALYEGLRELLSRTGPENSREREGGWYLVRTEVGECTHKVEVSDISILTRELAEDIQNLLRYRRNPWAVLLVPYLSGALEGTWCELVVYADGLEENWDAALLRRHLGERFRWTGKESQ